MKLMIIRHGQSVNNALFDASGALAGRSRDPELSDLGRRQADRLGAAFGAGLLPRPDVLVTSLMTRAVQTAHAVADALDAPVLGHLDAYEVGGPYEGDGEIADTDPALRRPYPGAPASDLRGLSARLQLPDGADETGWYRHEIELRHRAPNRASELLARIEQHHAGEFVALVCHQEFGDLLIKAALGADERTFYKLANTSTTLLELDDDTRRAWWINRFDHLDPADVSH